MQNVKVIHIHLTVKLTIKAESPISAGSPLNARGFLSNVQINAGSPINAGPIYRPLGTAAIYQQYT